MVEKPLHRSPPWEKAVVSKIRTMSVSEKCLVLESILCCLQQHRQVGAEFHPPPQAAPSPPSALGAGSLSTLCPRVGGSLSTLCPGGAASISIPSAPGPQSPLCLLQS